MKINDVLINNWHPPGDIWWDDVQARAKEALIEATITMTLTWEEYRELLDKDKSGRELLSRKP